MSDLIRREEAIQSLIRWSCSECSLGLNYKKNKGFCEGICHGANAIKVIESIPTTAEPKVGKWIEKEDGLEGQYWDCSVCGISWAFNDSGTPSEHGVNYCPNCGAKMERSE